jgi:replication-associated recombination protein RarA
MVMPRTKHGLSALGVLSALQKFIRRGMEREAMQCAIELMHTSKNYHSMVCKRLEVICHEDIGLANPMAIPFVHASMAQAREWYEPNPEKLGKSRMAVGNAIRLMCRGPKSREGDHFAAAHGWASILEGAKPELPDWIFDQHTSQGRKQGRGLDYFREVSTQLVPDPGPDPYEDEAYRLWALKNARGAGGEGEAEEIDDEGPMTKPRLF